jgi:hypothetical protein
MLLAVGNRFGPYEASLLLAMSERSERMVEQKGFEPSTPTAHAVPARATVRTP